MRAANAKVSRRGLGVVVFAIVASGVAATALNGCNTILGIGPATAASIAEPLTCPNYCNVVAQNCQGTNAEYLPAADGGVDTTLCMTICQSFSLGMYSPYPGDAGPATGNTVSCRLWHAQAAGDPANGPTAPQTHCPHAGPLGYGFCTDQSDPNATFITNFCQLDVPFCYEQDPRVTVYNGGATEGNTATIESADEQACQSALSQADADGGFYHYSGNALDAGVGDLTNTSGNTLNCRLWHFEFAVQTTSIPGQGPQTHCPHTEYPSVNAAGTPGPCVTPDD